LEQVGFQEIAGKIDPQAMANHLTMLEPQIIAKY